MIASAYRVCSTGVQVSDRQIYNVQYRLWEKVKGARGYVRSYLTNLDMNLPGVM